MSGAANDAAPASSVPAAAAPAAASASAPPLPVSSAGVRVAVVGCGHGELDKMYDCVAALSTPEAPIDLLICCGDFQVGRRFGSARSLIAAAAAFASASSANPRRCFRRLLCFAAAVLLSLSLVQSVRDYSDLACMACPPKYRALNTFYKYYTGEKQAPVLTLFIGGNHEASNYLTELSV